MSNKDKDTRYVKAISFTNEYREELELLQKEPNSSKLICKLLREYYNNSYNMDLLEADMVHIKHILEKISRGLSRNT